jgi:hypothetical protein
MKKWDTVSIDTMRAMRADGKTAREISRTIGRSESAVNTRLWATGLTSDGQRRSLKRRSTSSDREARILEVVALLEGKSGYDIGYILGVLCGDGFISHQKRGGVVLGLGVRSQQFAIKFSECLERVVPDGTRIRVFDYEYSPKDSIIKTPGREVLRRGVRYVAWNVTCCNPGVARFFERLKREFLAGRQFENTERAGILDGLFDSDGYIVRTSWTAGIGMKDLGILKWVSGELLARGIHNKVYTDRNNYYSCVSIYRKGAVRALCQLIKFSVEHRETARLQIVEG